MHYGEPSNPNGGKVVCCFFFYLTEEGAFAKLSLIAVFNRLAD